MVICIIAGGSGTRLWPLSQPNYPKHLLTLIGDRSLLQNTYARAQQLTSEIYIITEASHADQVAEQLPELSSDHIIIEPARRGTASCIVLALAFLKARHPGEVITFLHADHHIADIKTFTRTVAAAAQASAEEGVITLIGLRPTHAATGLGYIKAGSQKHQVDGLSLHVAERFVEKPDASTAEQYLAEGTYFWNLGLFSAPIDVFVNSMRESAPELATAFDGLAADFSSQADTSERYLAMPSQPIDTALIEKLDAIQVIPGEFDWADVGSFHDLHKILKGADTNAFSGEVHQLDCEDSLIHSSTRPIVAVGLKGMIVVETPHGLVVADKSQSQRIGDLVKQLQKP